MREKKSDVKNQNMSFQILKKKFNKIKWDFENLNNRSKKIEKWNYEFFF